MCDRTRECPDYKLLPIQLEIIREISDILPLSGAERNYREAIIDLMLEGNERIHSGPGSESADDLLNMIDHLHSGLESVDSMGFRRLPFGDPRIRAIENIRTRHAEAVRALSPEYGDRVDAMNAGHPIRSNDGGLFDALMKPMAKDEASDVALESIRNAREKAAMLPMTETERREHNERCDKLVKIGTQLGQTDPRRGLTLVLETVVLVAEQTALEKTVAARVKKDDPNYTKIREIYLGKKKS